MIYNDIIEKIRNALLNTKNITPEDETDIIEDHKSLTKAAVLIALTNQADPHIILTQRPQWLRSHSSQVAFPGGKMDDDDHNIEHTALREAQEELSINPAQVDIIATCPIYNSGSGYAITPIIGVVPTNLDIKPNPGEVDSWFQVPASFLFNRSNAEKKMTIWNGRERSYYDMQWQEYRIWGITAGIIANIARNIEIYQNDT